jgi:phage antirepressor YoqD-like protein/phage anti-repressor protein
MNTQITATTVAPESEHVDARWLHGELGLSKDFSDWIRQWGQKGVFPQQGEKVSTDGRPRKEYVLTVRDALKIAMATDTPQAEGVREMLLDKLDSAAKLAKAVTTSGAMDDDALLANALVVANRIIAEREAREAALVALVSEKDSELAAQSKEVERYHKLFEEHAGENMLISLAAKILDISQPLMFDTMRRWGWLTQLPKCEPTKEAINCGRLTFKRWVLKTPTNSGEYKNGITPLITMKGIRGFIERAVKEGVIGVGEKQRQASLVMINACKDQPLIAGVGR